MPRRVTAAIERFGGKPAAAVDVGFEIRRHLKELVPDADLMVKLQQEMSDFTIVEIEISVNHGTQRPPPIARLQSRYRSASRTSSGMPSPRTWTSYEQSSPAVAGRNGEHHAEHLLACRTKSPHDENAAAFSSWFASSHTTPHRGCDRRSRDGLCPAVCPSSWCVRFNLDSTIEYS
jgi:hypothetical protein